MSPKDDLQFLSVKSMLKDAMPPQAPPVFWKAPKHDFAITAASINIISSDSTSKSAQLSLQIASEIALAKMPVTPTRGINPFTGKNESEDYDKMLAQDAQQIGVLYVNTIMTESQLEREVIEAMPKMMRWIWLERDRGVAFPYEQLRLHQVNASMGKLMKQEHKHNFKQFVRQNKISLIVLNSFEFACRTQREKDDMMCMLKELRDELGCSVLVFTHESEKRLRTSTRGALPMLAMLADFVVPIADIAPQLEARKIEYPAPVTANELPAIPQFVKAEEVITNLKSASAEGLVESVELPELAV